MYKWEFLKKVIKRSFIQQQSESIDLIATNRTLVIQSEFKSYFLTTPTEEPKLKHWVNTTLNQLVIQFEPVTKCNKKITVQLKLSFSSLKI